MRSNMRPYLVILAILSIVAAVSSEVQSQDQASADLLGPDTAVGRQLKAPVNRLPVKDKWWWCDRW